MIGDISMLTGSVAICATDVNDCSGAPETSDCTAAEPAPAAASPTARGQRAADRQRRNLVRQARQSRSAARANGVNDDATDIAPA